MRKLIFLFTVLSGFLFAHAGSPTAKVLDYAIKLHKEEKYAKAERLYKKVLARDATNFQAIHMLGILCAQTR